jgi:hypothetical protein
MDALYNRGNALAMLGQLDDAVVAYNAVLSEYPAHRDARFNRDLLRKQLRGEQKQNTEDQSPSDEAGQGGAGDSKAGTQTQLSDQEQEMSEVDRSLEKWMLRVPDTPSDALDWMIMRQHVRAGYREPDPIPEVDPLMEYVH